MTERFGDKLKKILGLPTIVWVKRDRDQVHQSETLSHSGNA